MGKIADLFFGSHIDDTGLILDAKRAGDKAGQTMGQRMSGGIKSASVGMFAGIGAAGALAAFSSIDAAISGTIGFLNQAKDAALEEERSLARLDAALQANVKGWDGNSDAIEKVLASRMRLGFADDEQRDSLAKLVAVTKDHNKALELQRIAMDLARLRGMDLSAAGELVGKVYGGNIGILSRYGIQLKKGTTATEALAEIQAMAAGQAEAYAETNEGKLLASQIRVGEQMERIGARVLPGFVAAMESGADAVENLSGVLDLLDGKLPETEEGMQGLIDIINTLNPTAGNASSALDTASEAFNRIQEEERRAAAAARDAANAFDDSSYDIAESSRAAGFAIKEGFGDASKDAARAVRTSARDILASIQGLRAGAEGDAQAAAAALYDPIILAIEEAETAEELRQVKKRLRDQTITADERAELHKRRQELGKTLIEQNGLLLTYGTKAEQISKTSAFLASGFWAQAYEGATPEQAAALDAWRLTLQQRVAGMQEDSRTGAEGVVDNYTGELESGRGAVNRATINLVSGSAGPFSRAGQEARKHGETAGQKFADGIRSKTYAVATASARLAATMSNYLKQSSPAKLGPLSQGGGSEGWGATAIELLADGMFAHVRDVTKAASAVAGGMAAGFTPNVPRWSLASALALPTAGAVPLSGGVTTSPGTVIHNHNVTVPITGLLKARDSFEVGDRLLRLQENGVLDTPEEYS
jgi:hypothetical protein